MATAFGARGVGLGRPFLWAQTAYGEQGVIRTIRSKFFSAGYPFDDYLYWNAVMESEIVMAMRLLGLTRLDQLGPQHVECIQEMWK